MNFLTTIIKYNWNPVVLGTSFLLNLGLGYYKHNIEGVTYMSPIFDWCKGNSHIFQSCSYIEKDMLGGIVESCFSTPIFGGLSVPITSYYVYKNHINNKLNENDKKHEGCLCGELK